MNKFLTLALISLIFNIQACVPFVVPTPHKVDKPLAGTRSNLTEDKLDRIEIAVSTREDVLRVLGEPDKYQRDPDEFFYYGFRALYAAGWIGFIAGSPSSSGGGAATKLGTREENKVTITFDEDNIVQSIDLVKDKDFGSIDAISN